MIIVYGYVRNNSHLFWVSTEIFTHLKNVISEICFKISKVWVMDKIK